MQHQDSPMTISAPLPEINQFCCCGGFLHDKIQDEMPTLLNVLKSEMSSVGPQSLLVEGRDEYTPEQLHRHNVLPGITGWVQVKGRNALMWGQKFSLNL